MIEPAPRISALQGLPADHKAILAKYREPDFGQGVLELLISVVSFALLWALMWLTLQYSVWLMLLLSVPTAGFLVRLYILHHDCGHGSLFRSQRLNNITGFVLGLLVCTPYRCWRRQHALHHATSGDLDRRGFGDVDIRTVQEYLQLTPRQRLAYRLYRHPLFLFGLAPVCYFVLVQRFTFGLPKSWTKERADVHLTNLALAVCTAGLCWLVGLGDFLMIQLPVTVLASSLGVWLFYVQHNFEGTYWERHLNWNFGIAGLEGSSYYQLPRSLQWLTANIGFHHIHHMDSRIPSYRLKQCHADNAEFQQVKRLTLRESLACVPLKLWDEEQGKMVGFPP